MDQMHTSTKLLSSRNKSVKVEKRWFKTRLPIVKLAMLFCAFGSIFGASAWAQYDQITTGQVRLIEISLLDGSRFGLKLWNGSTTPPLCSQDSSGWAAVQVGILNATLDGLKAILATAMASKLSGLNVTVYAYNPQPGGGGNCMIGAIDLGP
jgi:hypothetical protein